MLSLAVWDRALSAPSQLLRGNFNLQKILERKNRSYLSAAARVLASVLAQHYQAGLAKLKAKLLEAIRFGRQHLVAQCEKLRHSLTLNAH